MSEAKLDITGDSSAAQRALDKAVKDTAKLRETIRQMNEDAKKGFKESSSAMDAWGRGMERMKQQGDKWAAGMRVMQEQSVKAKGRGGWLSAVEIHAAAGAMSGFVAQVGVAGAAAGVALRIYSQWNQKVEELSHAHRDLSLDVVRTLAKTGNLNLGPQADAWKHTVSGATPTQAIATLGGVQLSGETLSSERQFAVAAELAKLAPTGVDMTQTGALGADVADILGDGVEATDVADATVGIRKLLGEKTGEFQGRKFQKQISALKLGGMSGQDAMAHAIVALQSEYGSEAIKTLSDKTVRTADQRKMLKQVFTPEAVANVKRQLAESMSSDAATGQLSALSGFPSGREALGEQAVATAKAETTAQYGPALSGIDRARQLISTREYSRNGMMAGTANDLQDSIDRLIQFFMPSTGPLGEIEGGVTRGAISRQEADEFIRALKENTMATKSNTAAAPKKNVDAHIE